MFSEKSLKSEGIPDNDHAAKERFLARVADILEEMTRSGPYAVSPEWFTLDLTMPQVRVIFLLAQTGPQRMNTLASTLAISFSRATALVDQLVEKGLVSRWTNPQDRRSVLCTLTEQGKALAHRLLAERRSRWEERLSPLSLDELRKVYRGMELARQALRRAASTSEPVSSDSRQNQERRDTHQ